MTHVHPTPKANSLPSPYSSCPSGLQGSVPRTTPAGQALCLAQGGILSVIKGLGQVADRTCSTEKYQTGGDEHVVLALPGFICSPMLQLLGYCCVWVTLVVFVDVSWNEW